MADLSHEEISYLESKLKRTPSQAELEVVSAEWSEHCSYKSSKKYIKTFPTKGERVIVGPGYDAGVLDIGGGYALTVHIESHNHPSAIEPYGGAATGVGGVIRDIISLGTRPIALLNALRFYPINDNKKTTSSKARWLFKNVVKGIADYGNCIGIPTVAGEVEFDVSFSNYCLVDVACVGITKISNVIQNRAEPDDLIIIAGGSTGRDGIHGASFASKNLEDDNRSAVQIPDPFLEKILLEATLEATDRSLVRAIKDLGGGGLACCLSETSDSLGLGFEIELEKLHLKDISLTPAEIMISESQERMMYIISPGCLDEFIGIFKKYDIGYSIIGVVRDHQDLKVTYRGNEIVNMPSNLIAHAPILDRYATQPSYINNVTGNDLPKISYDMTHSLLSLLAVPSISSKRWVFEQFDHEVGLRTVLKPGNGDSSVLRLDNGKFLAIKLDGNSKHCYLDPYFGTLGCLSESRRNLTCVGALPIGVVDHLQFGNPQKPEVFWTFREAVKAISDYCNYMNIPVVGGKVSFYNETEYGPIKPTPVIGMLGLIENDKEIVGMGLSEDSDIYIIGETFDEMGGSEYYESLFGLTAGRVPTVDMQVDILNSISVHELIKRGLVNAAHDCSKGGLAVSLAEMSWYGNVGLDVNVDRLLHHCTRPDNILFSETNSRYVISTNRSNRVKETLQSSGVPFFHLGRTNKESGNFEIYLKEKAIIQTDLQRIKESISELEKIMNG